MSFTSQLNLDIPMMQRVCQSLLAGLGSFLDDDLKSFYKYFWFLVESKEVPGTLTLLSQILWEFGSLNFFGQIYEVLHVRKEFKPSASVLSVVRSSWIFLKKSPGIFQVDWSWNLETERWTTRASLLFSWPVPFLPRFSGNQGKTGGTVKWW